jgi:hypothetical protein
MTELGWIETRAVRGARIAGRFPFLFLVAKKRPGTYDAMACDVTATKDTPRFNTIGNFDTLKEAQRACNRFMLRR